MHRILLADDESHISHLVAQRLVQEGYSVRVARDGEEAWELAQEEAPDLVITDLQMPHMSGLELAMALRRHGPTSNVPLIMLTARGYVLDSEHVRDARITELHSKPFSVRRLVERVRVLLSGPVGASALKPASHEDTQAEAA